jgi:hypothetical protein
MNRIWLAAIVAAGVCGCGSRQQSASTRPDAADPLILVRTTDHRATLQPASITLAPDDFGAQVLAQDSATGGRDITGEVAWSVEPTGIVAIDAGYLTAIRPGKATLKATYAGAASEAEVTVRDAADRPWDIGEDIVPILSRAGCNTGGCHGRADGQNGFHLSIFGYDPVGDFADLTRNGGGRRVSRMSPASSLLLMKATGAAPHVGGRRIEPGSADYRRLEAWIADGAPMSRGKTHGSLSGIRVEPSEVRLDEPGSRQLRFFAKYGDGHERDVTRQAVTKTLDDSAATIDGKGKVSLLRRAETDLVVRYGSQVVSARVGTVINPDLKFDFAGRPRRNFVDDELLKRLAALKVPPSPPATDAAFLRRVTLDLTGQQPRPEQVREYLADKDPEKRVKVVDRLLTDRDFNRFWEIKLGDMLEITSARPDIGQTAGIYQGWVKARLAENMPWDKFVRTLLTAIGDPATREDAPANYALEGLDPKEQAEKTAQRFLGLRIRCAQCHDHPFDVWTQDDYFGLAATFAMVDRGGGPMPGGMMARAKIRIEPEGTVEHLRTRKPAEPKLLTRQPIKVGPNDDPRKVLADWMTAPDNPFFARAMANWTWAQLFGKGIADPPDDLSRSNPPVHPELLDALAKHFVAHKYDLRDLIRTIATSEAYAMSSATVPENASDNRLFSHQMPRPLTAHQMADALAQATDVPNRFANQPAGKRAIEIADPAVASPILETFGRCTRQNGCASVQSPALSLRQALLLIGGDVVEGKVTHPNGYLANLLELKPSPEEIVENLYLRTLCRPPTAEESSRWTAELKLSESPREAAEDLFWALLNSREFAFNH